MKRTVKKSKPRIWMPKKRAETFKDKRTKRIRTRQSQQRHAIQES